VASSSDALCALRTRAGARRWALAACAHVRFCGVATPEEQLRSHVADGSVVGTREEEAYALAFTCGVCDTRSFKRISKRAYHHGVVIVTCASCGNRHLIADNLKWFEDAATNIEKIMREKGEEVIRLSQFRLGDGGEAEEPTVQMEGLDLENFARADAWPAPVPVPTLADPETLVAAGEAAGKEAAEARRARKRPPSEPA